MRPVATGYGFDPHSREWSISLNLYFHFFALVSRQRRRRAPPFITQCLQNSAESGKRSFWRLGYLCLPCYVRDTAWSWKCLIEFRISSLDFFYYPHPIILFYVGTGWPFKNKWKVLQVLQSWTKRMHTFKAWRRF